MSVLVLVLIVLLVSALWVFAAVVTLGWLREWRDEVSGGGPDA